MSYNGSGTFNINTSGQPVVAGTVISSTAFNLLTTDLATGLSTALTKDGQTTPTANINLGSFKLTGVGNPNTAGDALVYGGPINATSINYSTTLTGGTGIVNLGSGQFYKDASGNVGIGRSPNYVLDAYRSGTGSPAIASSNDNIVTVLQSVGSTQGNVGTLTSHPLVLVTGNTERMRIDSSGNVGIGITSPTNKLSVVGAINSTLQLIGGATAVYSDGAIGTPTLQFNAIAGTNVGAVSLANTTVDIIAIAFRNPNGFVGSINTSGSSTSYITSSDYRLKNTVAPMTGALQKVAALKPCTYKWNADDSESQGFIAHELQEVVPECVTGEKDAVDAEGNPKYQGIDTSFLVATLTAALQEAHGLIKSLETRITALENK